MHQVSAFAIPQVIVMLALLASGGAVQANVKADAATRSTAHLYRVSVDRALTRLDVHACFTDSLPHHFTIDDPLAEKSLLAASILLNGKRQTVRPRDGALRFPVPSDDNCLDYRINLETITAAQQLNHAYRLPETILIRPQTWLWRPWSRGGRDIEFIFDLPASMAVSVPWQPLDAGPAHRHFRMAGTPFDWQALMAIGRLYSEEIQVPGGSLHLSLLPGPGNIGSGKSQSGQGGLALAKRWLKPAALAVSQAHGSFPRKDMQLLVIPIDGGTDAAPWAEVTRGGGPAAHFYMNAAADWPVFRDDWIATHELSHLLLPFISHRDKWLSEGIASYYQNILRGRTGLLSEQEAWQAMADGFRRGRQGTGTSSLRDATLGMRSREQYRRVYWTGAAIAFLGDVELRQRTAGRWSLDRLLAELQACCESPGKVWRARELFTHFDHASGEDVFLPLFNEHVNSRFFPRLEATWQALGIVISEDNTVKLQPETKTAQHVLRRSVMQPDASDAVSSE